MKFIEGMKNFFRVLVSTIKAPGPEFELSTKRVTAIALVTSAIIYLFTASPVDPVILGVLLAPALGNSIAGAITGS